jgi:hypothetical protein
MFGKRYEKSRIKSATPIFSSRTKLRNGISFTKKKTQFMMTKLAKKGASISVAR